MKNIKRILTGVIRCILMVPSITANAGNDDRRGTAGAPYLLINPWVKSSGWSGVNTANGTGVDALFSNVAGLARTTGTEVSFGYTSWLQNSGVSNIAAGLAQSLGDFGVLGLSVSSMNFGYLLYSEHLAIANFGGFPSLTLPIGLDNNFPYGANLTCKPFDEVTLFALSSAIEENTNLKDLTVRKVGL